MTVADEIAKLSELKNQGALTEEEFQAQKKALLAQRGAQGGSGAPGQGAQPGQVPSASRGKLSVLAIVAFALSFIAGPIALALAIIALIVIATSKGKKRGIGFAIGAICMGVFGWGMLAAIAVPSFINYMNRAKSSEATLNIDRIFEGAVVYYESERIDSTGQILTHQLPASTDWTPTVPCCEQPGEKCSAANNISTWQTPTWAALGFAMENNFYYQYRFVVEGNQFFCQARGDLDCDGVYSLFERGGVITQDVIQGSSGVYKANPLE